MSITPELLQNPTALSSKTQLLSAATDEAMDDAIDEELLLELLTILLLILELVTVVLELDLDVVIAEEDITEEVIAPHKLPFTLGALAAPLA